MKRKTRYTNEPVEAEVIEDFLPPPEELILKDQTVKVTIGLSKRSVDFFKKVARQRRVSYQRMIRRVLDLYASRHE